MGSSHFSWSFEDHPTPSPRPSAEAVALQAAVKARIAGREQIIRWEGSAGLPPPSDSNLELSRPSFAAHPLCADRVFASVLPRCVQSSPCRRPCRLRPARVAHANSQRRAPRGARASRGLLHARLQLLSKVSLPLVASRLSRRRPALARFAGADRECAEARPSPPSQRF
jgi:hypothetical protein